MANIMDIVRELENVSLKPSQEEILAYKKLLALIPQWESELMQAERAGMDVKLQRENLQIAKVRLEKLVAAYG